MFFRAASRWGPICLLVLASCGSDFRAAADLVLSGETVPPGGAYVIRVLGVDGTPIADIGEQIVPARSGEQNVALLLESDALYDGNDTVTARIFVESYPTSDTTQTPTSVGHTTFEAREGAEVTIPLELVADPRPTVGMVEATVAGDASEQLRLVAGAGFTIAGLTGLNFVAWIEVDGAPARRLGSAPSAGPMGTTYDVDGSPLVGRDLRVFITAEPTPNADVLSVPLGWTAYDGQTDTDLQEELELALGMAGDFEGGTGMVNMVVGHRNLAQAGFDASDEAEVRLHCEHVHNFLVDAGSALEFNGDTNAERPASDPIGLITYLDRLDLQTMVIAEHPAQASSNTAAASACVNGVQVLVGTVQTVAASVAGGTNVLADFDQDLSPAVDDLSGAGSGEGFACIRNRLQELSLFEITPP